MSREHGGGADRLGRPTPQFPSQGRHRPGGDKLLLLAAKAESA